MKQHIMGSMLVFGAIFVLVGCAKSPGDVYISQQIKSAKSGNHWAEYLLWKAYYEGTNGVAKNPPKADTWLRQFVKDVFMVRFEAVNGFNPRSADDYLQAFLQAHIPIISGKDRIGIAGFLRTKKEGNRLVASFLTNEPDRLRAYIEDHPHLRLVSVEPMTPQTFIEHENSIQESL